MEKKQNKKQIQQVTMSKEEGFDISNCFEGKFDDMFGFNFGADAYFNCYSHFGIHEDMLRDHTRTETYQSAIAKNQHLFKDKIVLDIGCGTGILSLFAAQAGAKHVYAVEEAAIVYHARKIVELNGFEKQITVIQGKVEEIDLPVKEVDIIISEWMGYFLLYEAMLDTVLFARDKWLAADGKLFPDRASLYVAGIEDCDHKDRKMQFWNNVYGFNMQNMKQWVLLEPVVDYIAERQVVTSSCPIFDIELKTVKKEDLNFSSSYELTCFKKDYCHGLVAWFEVYFSHCHIPLKLSTSPFLCQTHWKQTIFYFDTEFPIFKNDKIKGSIAVKKNKKNSRELDIKISANLKNKVTDFHKVQMFRLT